jgi:hypothetical protein
MVRWLVLALAVAGGGYAVLGSTAWLRYGHAPPPNAAERDALLDRFMPVYDIVERHHTLVHAPAAVTFDAACEQDLQSSPIVRAIFETRSLVLRSRQDGMARPRGVLAWAQSLGWGVLAEVPGREVVVGAVTQPWEADVTFRALSPDAFAAFHEPGFVKIVWTLRADPVNVNASIFRTETRALATDAVARVKFRRYWSFVSPGVSTIRWLSLGPLRRHAERRSSASS